MTEHEIAHSRMGPILAFIGDRMHSDPDYQHDDWRSMFEKLLFLAAEHGHTYREAMELRIELARNGATRCAMLMAEDACSPVPVDEYEAVLARYGMAALLHLRPLDTPIQ